MLGKKGKAIALEIIVAVLIVTGLSRDGAASEQTAVVGMPAIASELTTLREVSAIAITCTEPAYERLVTIDEQGNPQPALAVSWKLINPTTWQFKLRKGVKFHNGELFDAQAVKFSLDLHLTAKPRSARHASLVDVESVQIVDDYTVNIRTKEPVAHFLACLTYIYMFPPKYFTEKGAEGFNKRPMGTGPFRITEWEPESHISYEANKEYWGKKPKLSALKIRHLPDISARVMALQTGEIHLAVDIYPEHGETLRRQGYNIQKRALEIAYFIHLRSTIDTPLKDKRVRQALNYAVDKDVICKKLFGDAARPLDGQFVGPAAFGYNPNLKPYPYDPERAKQLLAEAGYPKGFKVRFHGTRGRYFRDKEVSEEIAKQLGRVGISCDFVLIESATWVKLYLEKELGPLGTGCWYVAPFMDLYFPIHFYLRASGRKLFESDKFENLYRKQKVEMDPEKRKKLLWEVSEYLRDEGVVLFISQMPRICANASKLDGFRVMAGNEIYFNDAYLK